MAGDSPQPGVGVVEQQRRDPLGVVHRQPDRDRPARDGRQHRGALDAGCVEHRQRVGGHLLDAVTGLGEPIGHADTPHVVHQQSHEMRQAFQILGELRELPHVLAVRRAAHDLQHRGSRAERLIAIAPSPRCTNTVRGVDPIHRVLHHRRPDASGVERRQPPQ